MYELGQSLKSYSQKLFYQPLLKLLGIETIIIFRHSVALVLLCVILDFISGVIASTKNKSLSSLHLRNGILKILIYLLFLILGIILQTITKMGNIEATIAGLIAMTEGVSMVENIELAFPGILPKTMLRYFEIEKLKMKIRRYN